jgi:hypothetical protein
MIEGIHFDIRTDELKAHLEARVLHHRERAAFYEAQKATFADAPTEQMSNDPVQGLKAAGKRHLQQADLFAFMATHVAANETYRLSSHDLSTLELVPQR